MKCPECMKEGKKSKVYINYGPTSEKAIYKEVEQFYDEEERLHTHDPNQKTKSYHCSNGHSWTESKARECWCGWPSEEEIKRRSEIMKNYETTMARYNEILKKALKEDC